MALLQISEPGQSPDPHQRRIAVGIDLGTTHSLVAAVRSGVAECLPDAQGRVILPSAVRYLSEHKRAIGFDALAAQADDPEHTVVSVKRFMGRALADVAGADKLPYRFEDRPGMLALHTRAGVKSPVEVSAEILATLRQRAEDSFDTDELFGAVITVPAYFDDAQRQATKDAAQLAGLEVLRLINEPTAAAIAYGLENGSEGLYAIYDLGGGTFDISLLRLAKGVFEVVATGGDSALGGDDYDERVAELLLAKSGLPALSAIDAHDKRAVLREARSLKQQLSVEAEAQARLVLKAGRIDASLTRAEFEAATGPLTQRTVDLMRKVLRDAKVGRDEVQGVVLVGGSTRMPVVRAAVEAFFGRAPLTNLNPDEVVALGAAIQANQLAGHGRRRRAAAARRDAALARPRDHGRAGRTHHPAQQPDPDRARPGLHDLPGRPDRARAARGAGRARAGRAVPLAGALRAARHPADGGRCGAHPRQLHGRRRRAAQRQRAGAGLRRRGQRDGQAELRPGRRADRADAAGRLCHRRRATCAIARCARPGSMRSGWCSPPARRWRPMATCSTPRSVR